VNIKFRYKLIDIAVILIGVFVWGRHSKNPATSGVMAPKPITVLPTTDTEQIVVDPVRHQLIIVKPTGSETLILPDRSSVIDIRKDGTTLVTSKKFGFEERPFIGWMYSDQFRFVGGSSLFYFKKLDIGAGVGVNKDLGSFILFGHVAYKVWDNVSIGLTYDHRRNIGAALTVRI
jgi:hypothetical protein